MTIAEADVRRQLGRLPKETTPRVILAVLAFVIASIAVGESVWYGLYTDHANAVLQRCGGATVPTDPVLARRMLLCKRSSEHERILWTLAWGPAALGLAGIGAATASGLRRRSLTSERLDRLSGLQSLADDAAIAVGVERPPLLWRPARPIALARADGMVRPYVEVGPALMSWSLTAPRQAAAVLRHENAHRKLHDVPASRILWWSGPVGLLIVVPFVITLWDVDAFAPLWGVARLAVVALLIGCTRAAVLRAREFDADLVAASDDPQALIDALPPDRPKRGGWALVTVLFAHHPPTSTRRATVERPWLAYRLAALDAVLVGFTAAFGAPVLSRLARGWFQYGNPATYAELFGWGAIGLVLGAWLAIMLLRAVGAARVSGDSVHLGTFVWGLSAAALAGILLFDEPLSLDPRPVPTTVLGVGALLMLVIGLVVSAVWLRDLIAEWLEPLTERLGDVVTRRTLIVVGALLTALLLGVLASMEHSGAVFDQNIDLAVLLGADPRELFTLASLTSVLSGEWFSVLLMAVALGVPIGLAVFGWQSFRQTVTHRSLLSSPDNRKTLVVAFVGAGVAFAAFLVYRLGWDPDAAARAHGWLAAAQIAYASPMILGVLTGLSAATLVLASRRTGLPVIGAAGLVSAIAAAIGAWVELGAHDGLWPIVRDVAVIALITALVAGASLGALGMRGRLASHWPVVLVVPLLAAIPLVAIAVDASRATPSVEADTVRYTPMFQMFVTELKPFDLMTSACSGPVDRKLLGMVDNAREELDRPGFRPATVALRGVHDPLREIFALCARGIREATAAGTNTLGDAASNGIVREVHRLDKARALLLELLPPATN